MPLEFQEVAHKVINKPVAMLRTVSALLSFCNSRQLLMLLRHV